ncbi:MAG: hypothetical protein IKM39_05375 [Clostridia bacterium]|nr:hypothetical protein [Clostridia bacterium]
MTAMIQYPIKGRKLKDVLSQHTLDMLLTQLDHWKQGPGVYGRLHLHSCWGTVSVLDKGYHGESVHTFSSLIKLFERIYEKSGNPKWRMDVDAMVQHLLYLQDENGGFIHSGGEFEPMFNTAACPIHFFNPMMTLCEYYQWPFANEDIKALIPEAVERHFEFAKNSIWMIGNASKRPLPFPGWCGVTNQDLYATVAIATMAKVFNKPEIYEQYGKPVVDYYLSDAYYYKDIGLFERGDGTNFAERTVYLSIIMNMLWKLHGFTGEQRLIDAYYNVAGHLFDAVFVGEDGLTYLARGAKTDAKDKSKVYGWEYGAIAFDGYPGLIRHMERYLTAYPDVQKSQIVEQLKDTVAAYVFVDGTIPMGIFNSNPVFSIASNSEGGGWAQFVMDELGEDNWHEPQRVELPCVHRRLGDFTWKQQERLWAIEEKGVRKFGGFTRYAAGVVKGPDAQLVEGSFDTLEAPDFIETLDAGYLETEEKPFRS